MNVTIVVESNFDKELNNITMNIISCGVCTVHVPEDECNIDVYNRKVCPVCQEDILQQTATVKLYTATNQSTYKWNSLFGFTDVNGVSTTMTGINGYDIRPNAMVAILDNNYTPVIRGWMTGRYDTVKHKHASNDFYDALNSRHIIPNFPIMISLSQNGQLTMAVEIILHIDDIEKFKNLVTEYGITFDQLRIAFS